MIFKRLKVVFQISKPIMVAQKYIKKIIVGIFECLLTQNLTTEGSQLY